MTAASILGASAAVYEGRYAQSFPAFGAERRGAPVLAFTRISDVPIRDRSQIYNPGYVIVLDSSLLAVTDVAGGLIERGSILINSPSSPEEVMPILKGLRPGVRVATVDATSIALERLGVPIVNSAMLGAFCAVSELVALDSLKRALGDEFGGLGPKNIAAAEAAFAAVNRGERA